VAGFSCVFLVNDSIFFIFSIIMHFILQKYAIILPLCLTRNAERKEVVDLLSKSDDDPNGSIYLMDDADTIIRKCKRAVMDSIGEVQYADDHLGIKNLIDIYSACTNKSTDEVVKIFDGKGYGDFKFAVGETIVSILKPIQNNVVRLEKDKLYIDTIIKDNAEKATNAAIKTLRKVQRKIGFPDRIK